MYLALIRLAFQRQLAYRTANLAGFATNAFFGAMRAYVIIALFGTHSAVAGYTVQAAVTYTGLTQLLLSYVAIFGWWDMMRTIRSGEVASDLSRPIDYFWYWGAQDCGRGVAQLFLRGAPIMMLYVLFYPVVWPPTLWHWLALPFSLALALLVSFAWRFIVSLAAFWVQDAVGIGRFAWTVAIFMSGFIMPLAFLPPWLITLMRLTPFPTFMNTPFEIYLGILNGPALLGALVEQGLWFVLLYSLAQVLLKLSVQKLIVQGG